MSRVEAVDWVRRLRERGLRVVHPPEDWLVKVQTDGVVVDLLHRANGFGVAEGLARAETMAVLSVEMAVLAPTDLVTEKLLAHKDAFRWTSHTFTHLNLDNAPIETIKEEIWKNIDWAQEHGVPIDETERMLGLNHADFYGFDVDELRPLADRIGPTPAELGQTDPSVFSKWDALREVGRPWLTGKEATGAGMH